MVNNPNYWLILNGVDGTVCGPTIDPTQCSKLFPNSTAPILSDRIGCARYNQSACTYNRRQLVLGTTNIIQQLINTKFITNTTVHIW